MFSRSAERVAYEQCHLSEGPVSRLVICHNDRTTASGFSACLSLECPQLLPRSQTSLSLRKWLSRKGGREGEGMRDVWEILFFKMAECSMADDYTIFLKRSIDLLVLRILKGKWFFLIQWARRKLLSYNRTGYSIITGFAISMPFSCRQIIEETASDLLERKKAVRQ